MQLGTEEGVARALWGAYVGAVEAAVGCSTFGKQGPVRVTGPPSVHPLRLDCARFVRWEGVLGGGGAFVAGLVKPAPPPAPVGSPHASPPVAKRQRAEG